MTDTAVIRASAGPVSTRSWCGALPPSARRLPSSSRLAIAALTGVIARGNVLYKVFVDPFVLMVDAPDLLVQTLWEGLVSGVLYALIALGFVLIFKASGVFNFAQGIMVVFAALTLVGLHEKGVPAFLAARPRRSA